MSEVEAKAFAETLWDNAAWSDRSSFIRAAIDLGDFMSPTATEFGTEEGEIVSLKGGGDPLRNLEKFIPPCGRREGFTKDGGNLLLVVILAAILAAVLLLCAAHA
jgi:hypothetical protein